MQICNNIWIHIYIAERGCGMSESVAVTKNQNVPEDAMNFFCFNILLLDSHSRIHWLDL